MKFFPLDCTKKCPHLKTWDLSVDDWTSVCDILNVQVDDCDGDYIRYRCPLDEKTETNAFEELIVMRSKGGDGTIYRQRPLVRCKNCCYWQDNNGGPHPECRWGHDETPDANDFCSFASDKRQMMI